MWKKRLFSFLEGEAQGVALLWPPRPPVSFTVFGLAAQPFFMPVSHWPLDLPRSFWPFPCFLSELPLVVGLKDLQSHHECTARPRYFTPSVLAVGRTQMIRQPTCVSLASPSIYSVPARYWASTGTHPSPSTSPGPSISTCADSYLCAGR